MRHHTLTCVDYFFQSLAYFQWWIELLPSICLHFVAFFKNCNDCFSKYISRQIPIIFFKIEFHWISNLVQMNAGWIYCVYIQFNLLKTWLFVEIVNLSIFGFFKGLLFGESLLLFLLRFLSLTVGLQLWAIRNINVREQNRRTVPRLSLDKSGNTKEVKPKKVCFAFVNTLNFNE